MPTVPEHDNHDTQPVREAIAFRAEWLWQQAGSPPPDRDVEFWLAAEQELKKAGGQKPGGPATDADGRPANAKVIGNPSRRATPPTRRDQR